MALGDQREWTWKIFLILFGIVLGMLAVEVSLRMLKDRPRVSVKWTIYRRLAATEVAYDLKPNSQQSVDGVLYKINSHGMRDREYPLEKGEHSYRLAVLGDSCTFGDGVSLEDTYVKQLEYVLNQEHHLRKKIEVLNLGVNGYNTVQELWRLKEMGLKCQPDLILLGYYLNDPLPVDLKAVFGGHKQKELPYRIPLPFKAFLRRHSQLYMSLSNVYGGILQWFGLRSDKVRRSATYYLDYYSALYQDTFEGWEKCQKALLDFSRIAATEGVLYLVVIFPALIDLEGSYPFGFIHHKVASFLGENDIAFLDLLPTYLGKDSRSLWAASDNRHPNRQAHQIAARAISEYLMAKGLLDSSRAPQVEESPERVLSLADSDQS